MTKTLIACVALSAALAGGAAWTSWPAPKAGGCCAPGADCCFPGSPCCGEDCCYEGSPCCYPGSPCCGESAACCATTPTSADAPPAADAPAAGVTVIAVEEMDCPSCAKKVLAKQNEVAGVGKAVADTKAMTVSVTPKDKAAPSARALWEAVEKAGYKPTRLEGPGGAFTALPKE